jgi:catechol-2,3-dioxygenase
MEEAIEFLSAVLIYSQKPERLAAFYRDILGVPLEPEKHGSEPLHYGCELGDVHFAIHPSTDNVEPCGPEQRIRLAFNVFSTEAIVKRLKRNRVKLLASPKNADFAVFTRLHDPDGNCIELTELRDSWFEHLRSRKAKGADIVTRWERKKRA